MATACKCQSSELVKKVPFGSTGKLVSSVGLGGAQFHYDSSNSKEAVIDTIKFAYSIGINYFDTAPYYQSEAIFGETLQDFTRSSYFLATKIGRYPTIGYDFSAKQTESSVQRSLQLLRTDYLDLVQVHDFDFAAENNAAIDVLVSETLPSLDKLRQGGVLRYIGVTSYDLPLMKQLVERSPVKIDVVLCNSRLTLVDQSIADYAAFFKSRGIAVVNASPLSLGVLRSSNVPDWLPISNELKEASQKAVTMCKLSGYIVERLANAFSFVQGQRLGVDVLLTGAASRRLLELNLAAYREGLTKAENIICQEISQQIFGQLPAEARDVNRLRRAAHFQNGKK